MKIMTNKNTTAMCKNCDCKQQENHTPTWSAIMIIVNGDWKHIAGQPYFELTVSLPEKSITPVYCNGRTVTGGTYKFKSREAAMEAIRIMHVDDYLAMEGIK